MQKPNVTVAKKVSYKAIVTGNRRKTLNDSSLPGKDKHAIKKKTGDRNPTNYIKTKKLSLPGNDSFKHIVYLINTVLPHDT